MTTPGEYPTLALVNANILTLVGSQPHADTVLITGSRIGWVGDKSQLSPSILASALVIDCHDWTIVPGFIDAHCHLLAYAASLKSVDCSPSAVSSIRDIQVALRHQAQVTPRGEWIRATGYSDTELLERRHPTRWDIDELVPDHPVKLGHRSGHALVLNSLALERVGVTAAVEEPPGGTIDRDLDTGEPNGLLLEMDEWLDERIPRVSSTQLADGLSKAGNHLNSQGVTSVEDATPTDSIGRLRTLDGLAVDADFHPHLYAMPSVGSLDDMQDANWDFGELRGRTTSGHAKIMLTQTSGRLFPSREVLNDQIDRAHGQGFPVAIHAVESDAVVAAAQAIAAARVPSLRDRVEHASECPPEALEALVTARPVVVSQPGFLLDSGDRYLEAFKGDVRLLYRFRTLAKSGLMLAASSDAPVTAPSPLKAMQAAVTRESVSGQVIGRSERLTASQALEMHTSNAAYAVCAEEVMGTIAPGKRADLVALSGDPTRTVPESIGDIRVVMTVIGGQIVWQA